MKLQLIFAPPQKKTRFGELNEQVAPPLGVLYLAAYIREHLKGIQINIVDGTIKGWKYTLSKITDFNPDLLGISFYSVNACSAYKLANIVKEKCPKTLLVMGGPHVSALPEECMKRSKADVAVIGEGETTLLEIAKLVNGQQRISLENLANIDGIVYRNQRNVIHFTNPRKVIMNLDEIPFPARDLVNMNEYKGWWVYRRLPETTTFFSRGCPYNCTFCSNSVWKTSKPYLRIRSAKNIVDEIEHLMYNFGIKEFMDHADEFNNNGVNAMEVCKEIIKRKLDIPWKCQLRVHPLSEELVKLMAESGCWYVHLGIESANKETLKGINKRINIEQVFEACKLLKKYDIKILALFMIYNAWEENGQLKYEDTRMSRNTLAFAESLLKEGLVDFINWSVTKPYPGSELYRVAKKYKLIKKDLQENWDGWVKETEFVMSLPGVKQSEMARLKTAGQLKRGWRMLLSGDIGIKDFTFFFKKLLKLIKNEIQSRSK
jgi:radical SAM superfamily enzyme YgiQ (UPF0313 family)